MYVNSLMQKVFSIIHKTGSYDIEGKQGTYDNYVINCVSDEPNPNGFGPLVYSYKISAETFKEICEYHKFSNITDLKDRIIENPKYDITTASFGSNRIIRFIRFK